MSHFTRTGTEHGVGRLVTPLVIAGAIGTRVLGSAWKTGRAEFFFLPGVGRKATVTTAGGVARCVLAAPNLDY
jgi:hypothetical protein